MNKIIAYLTFDGNCRQAMTFYRDCLGGQLSFQSVAESPISEKLPPSMKKFILHSTLQKGDVMLMATDIIGEQHLVKGNDVSILIECGSEQELYKIYQKLSANGSVTHPVEDTYWDSLFGGLTDKFGHHWLLYCKKQSTKTERSIK